MKKNSILYKNFNIEKNFYLQLKIKDQKENILTLNYHLFHSDLLNRWKKLVIKNNEDQLDLTFNYKKNFKKKEIKKMFLELNKNIINFNKKHKQKLSSIEVKNIVEENEKNKDIFSVLEEQIKEIKEDDVLIKNINNEIEKMKSIISSKNKNCSCFLDFKNSNLKIELEPEDFFLFSSEIIWGTLYLMDSDFEKSPLNILSNYDIDHLKRKEKEKTISSHVFLNFINMQIPGFYNNYNFYNWWKKKSISNIINPNMNLKDFSFGFIPIGFLFSYQINTDKIIIIDEKINKLKWNKNVWSNFDNFFEFKIVNNDYLKKF